jgi:hypothetical protein
MCRSLSRVVLVMGLGGLLSVLQGCSHRECNSNFNPNESNGFQTELYFGGAFREPNAWPTFLLEVVTPRFSGYTVLTGDGNWKDRVGMPTKILRIIHSQTDMYKIEEIRTLFIQKFNHQSVMRVTMPIKYEF